MRIIGCISAPAIALVALASARLANAQPPSSHPAPQVAAVDRTANDEGTGRNAEHFRVGALGGVGFPRPFAIEAIVKMERLIAIGAEYSMMPTMTFSGVRTTLWAVAADARFFPFRSPFYVGVKGGRQHLEGSGSMTVPRYGTIGESMAVDTWFINPRVGLLWTTRPGFTIGVEAGAQIPVSSATTSTLPAGVSAGDAATSAVNTFGKNVLPTFDLLRLGWLL